MSMQFSFGKGLLRAAVSLGFLGCLIAQGSLCGAGVASEPLTVTIEVRANASVGSPDFCGSRSANPNHGVSDALRFESSDSELTKPVEIGMPEEFGVAFEDEDSIEMFRFDVQQRAFALDRTAIGLKVVSKVAQATRPNISLPLLV